MSALVTSPLRLVRRVTLADQPRTWTALWVGWGAAFAVIEGCALHNDIVGDTLSEHFRHWFRTDTHLGRSVWIGVSGVFFSWFAVHIAVKGSA